MKQRLIGAAVIIALAVIFIPMLLEGPKNDDSVTMKIDIPDKPVYEIPSRLEPPPGPESIIIPPAEKTTETPVEIPVPATEVAVPAEEKTAEQVEPSTRVVEVPSIKEPEPAAPVVIKTPEQVTPKPKKPAAKKPQAKPVVTSATGFVIQVGSFSQRQNALVLSDKLTANGYPAFVESGKSNNKSIFRVKVGPQPTRAEADQLRIKLLDSEKLKGIIVAHP